MTSYKCERCNYETLYKSNLLKHLKTVKICESISSDIPREDLLYKIKYETIKDVNIYKCKYCPKKLSSKSGIYLHEKKCRNQNNNTIVEQEVTNNTAIVEQVVANNNTFQSPFDIKTFKSTELYKELVSSIKEELNIDKVLIGTQNNAQNIIQYTTNNMYSFGSEQTDYITKDKDFLSKCFLDKDIPEIVKQIHFSNENLQNSNIRLKNNDEKSDFVEVYNEGHWVAKDKDLIINELVEKGYRKLSYYDYKNRKEFQNICKDENVSYDELKDWLDDVMKIEENRKVYYKDILILLINREILLLGLENTPYLPTYIKENEKIGIMS